MGLAGWASAQSPAATSTGVLSIDQTGYITEQGSFTVSMQVASSTNIHFVYFTFCQLTSSVCYLPVTMLPQAGNWFVGTTNPMSSYHGMTVGVKAGYNITIVFNDNSTQTEPAMPNAFTNLTIAQTVTGEYMFEMGVSPDIFGLSGVVRDAVTATAIAGATVTLTSGNTTTTTTDGSGAYSFSGLVNGTYSLTIADPGYHLLSKSVTIAGQSTVQNVTISSDSSSSGGSGTGSSGNGGSTVFLGLTLWQIVLPVVLVIGAIIGYLLLRRRKASRPSPPAPSAGQPES